ncbi:terminase small subunit [Desulfoferula mesophila]
MNCPACNSFQVHVLATQAAIRAGCYEKTAAVIGAENLIKPDIAASIQAAMHARAERTRITADKVVGELARWDSLSCAIELLIEKLLWV